MNKPSMPAEFDLKGIAQRAYLPYASDGMLDIIAGGMLFFCGGLLQPNSAHIVVFLAFLPLAMLFIRRYVVYPRVGYIQPATGSRRERIVLGALLVVGLGTAVLLGCLIIARLYPESVAAHTWPMPQLHVLLTGLLAAILVLLGILTQAWRWFIYAILGISAATAAKLLIDWSPVDGLAACGLGIAIYGLIMLRNFARRYPVLDTEQLPGGKQTGGKA